MCKMVWWCGRLWGLEIAVLANLYLQFTWVQEGVRNLWCFTVNNLPKKIMPFDSRMA